MPTFHQLALLLVRIFAGLNIAAGISLLAGTVITQYAFRGGDELLQIVPGTLAGFGVVDLVGGLGMAVFSRPIAAYAARHLKASAERT